MIFDPLEEYDNLENFDGVEDQDFLTHREDGVIIDSQGNHIMIASVD